MVLLLYACCIAVAFVLWMLPWSYGWEAYLIYSAHLCVIIRCQQVVPEAISGCAFLLMCIELLVIPGVTCVPLYQVPNILYSFTTVAPVATRLRNN